MARRLVNKIHNIYNTTDDDTGSSLLMLQATIFVSTCISICYTSLYHVKIVQIRDIESNLNSDGNTDERLKLCLVYSFVPIKKCRRLI